MHCRERDDNVLKEFIFPTNAIPDASIALVECEQYCGRIEKCWGCSAHKNGSYKWNAVTQCEDIEEWEGSPREGVQSQGS